MKTKYLEELVSSQTGQNVKLWDSFHMQLFLYTFCINFVYNFIHNFCDVFVDQNCCIYTKCIQNAYKMYTTF